MRCYVVCICFAWLVLCWTGAVRHLSICMRCYVVCVCFAWLVLYWTGAVRYLTICMLCYVICVCLTWFVESRSCFITKCSIVIFTNTCTSISIFNILRCFVKLWSRTILMCFSCFRYLRFNLNIT